MDGFDLNALHGLGGIPADESALIEASALAVGVDLLELNRAHILDYSWPCQRAECTITLENLQDLDSKVVIYHQSHGSNLKVGGTFDMRLGGHTPAQHDAIEAWLMSLHPEIDGKSVVDIIIDDDVFRALVADYKSAIEAWAPHGRKIWPYGGTGAPSWYNDAMAAYCHVHVLNACAIDIPKWIQTHFERHPDDMEKLQAIAYAFARAQF